MRRTSSRSPRQWEDDPAGTCSDEHGKHGWIQAREHARDLLQQGCRKEPENYDEAQDHNVGVYLLRSLKTYLERQSKDSKNFFKKIMETTQVIAMLDEIENVKRRRGKQRQADQREAFDRMHEMQTAEYAEERARELAPILLPDEEVPARAGAVLRLYRGLTKKYRPGKVEGGFTGTNFTDCPFSALQYARGRYGEVMVLEVPESEKVRITEALWSLDGTGPKRYVLMGRFDPYICAVIPAKELRDQIRERSAPEAVKVSRLERFIEQVLVELELEEERV